MADENGGSVVDAVSRFGHALQGGRNSANGPLKPGNGGGTSGGMTDDWKESVDRQLGQLHGDVRALLYGLLGAAAFLLAAIAALYAYTDSKAEGVRSSISSQVDGVDARLRALETSQARVEGKLDSALARQAKR